jgi:hypothetical protein
MIITLPYPRVSTFRLQSGAGEYSKRHRILRRRFLREISTSNQLCVPRKERGPWGLGTARFDGLIFAHGGEVLWTDVNPFLDCPRMITDNHQPLLFGRHSTSLDGERVNQSGVVLQSDEGCSHGAKSEVGSVPIAGFVAGGRNSKSWIAGVSDESTADPIFGCRYSG